MALQRLRLIARRLGLAAGAGALGLRPGSGTTWLRGGGGAFAGYRAYRFGDDLRLVDWNVTARGSHPVVKEFLEQRAIRLALVLDGSASMRFGTGIVWRAAQEAAALIALVAGREGARMHGVVITSGVEARTVPGTGEASAQRLARWILDYVPRRAGTALGRGLGDATGGLPRGALVVVVSDFIDSTIDAAVRRASLRHDVVAIIVAPPPAEAWPDAARVRVRDAETGRSLWIDTASAQGCRRLLEREVAVRRRRRTGLARSGALCLELRTDRAVAPQLRRLCRPLPGA